MGEVVSVDENLITSSLKAGHVPVLYSLAITKDGQVMNVNADVAAKVLIVINLLYNEMNFFITKYKN